MHTLLLLQLKRILGKDIDCEKLPHDFQALADLVSQSYQAFDRELRFYEHTLSINSQELNETSSGLKKALGSLAEAQRLAQTGSWELNLATQHIECSDELYRILELDKKESPLSPEVMLRWIHPEDVTQVESAMHTLLECMHCDISYRLCLPSGAIKFIHDQREVVCQHDHTPHIIRGTMQDISSKQKQQENLLLYAKIFHTSTESILITDAENKIVSVNQSFTKTTGYTIEDLQGKNPSVLSAGQTPKELYEQMWFDLKAKGHWQGELIDRKKSGEHFPKWISISVSYSEFGDVLYHIASFTDITDRKEAQKRIHYLAHHDSLTGLINRFSLDERLEQAIHTAHRNHNKLALLFIDMDRFKLVNDTMGHAAGDELLIEVSARLQDSVRESDIVARLGGDEFVIVLSKVKDSLAVARIAGNIIATLGEPYMIQEQRVFSSPSIGASIFPADGNNADTLMKNADTAMYHAKEQGRNNFQFFTKSLNRDTSERLKIESSLRYALEQKHFELHYQPKISTISGKVSGVEALIRWRHPEHGLIPPDKFIPIAEDTRLIVPMGLWVLKEACSQLQAWKTTYATSISMAVNVSAQQLHAVDLVENIQHLIQHYQLNPGDLELEITESTAMENPAIAIAQLHRIRALGVALSIDDFGTGYSSLSYLKQMPVQNLKIDRSFVKDLELDDSNAKISAATLALAHNLGLSVVAEGVENQAQKDFLIAHGCETLQGYFFSKPLPASEAEDFIFKKT